MLGGRKEKVFNLLLKKEKEEMLATSYGSPFQLKEGSSQKNLISYLKEFMHD